MGHPHTQVLPRAVCAKVATRPESERAGVRRFVPDAFHARLKRVGGPQRIDQLEVV